MHSRFPLTAHRCVAAVVELATKQPPQGHVANVLRKQRLLILAAGVGGV